MTLRTKITIGLLALLLPLAGPLQAQSAEEAIALEATAKKLEGRIMAPCCSANPVSEEKSHSPSVMSRSNQERGIASGPFRKSAMSNSVLRSGSTLAYRSRLGCGNHRMLIFGSEMSRPARQCPNSL